MSRKIAIAALTITTTTILASCAPVSVIKPVALQNEKLAGAMKSNADSYVQATLPLVEDKLLRLRVLLLRELDSNSRAEAAAFTAASPPNPDQWWRSQADALVQARDTLDGAREVFEQEQRSAKPLAAAVAFDELPVGDARQMGDALVSVSAMARASPPIGAPFRAELVYSILAELPIVKSFDADASAIRKSFRDLAGAVRSNASQSAVIAAELRKASESGADASKFLNGLSENPEFLGSVATIVEQNSDNEERRAAARKLLESLEKPQDSTSP